MSSHIDDLNVSLTGNSSITINGKKFSGQNISVVNGVMTIDGKIVTPTKDMLEGKFTGHVRIIIEGDARSVTTMSGDVEVNGNVEVVETMSGDVRVAGSLTNKCSTMSGDIVGSIVGGR